MRSLAGSVALAAMLIGSPLAAHDATEQPRGRNHGTTMPPICRVSRRPRHRNPMRGCPPARLPLRSAAMSMSHAPGCHGAGTAAFTPAADHARPQHRPRLAARHRDRRRQGQVALRPISSGRRGFATATGTFHPQWASRDALLAPDTSRARCRCGLLPSRHGSSHGTSAVGLLGMPAHTAVCAWRPATLRAAVEARAAEPVTAGPTIVRRRVEAGAGRRAPRMAGGG